MYFLYITYLLPISCRFIAHSLANIMAISGLSTVHFWPNYCPFLANLLRISGQPTTHLWHSLLPISVPSTVHLWVYATYLLHITGQSLCIILWPIYYLSVANVLAIYNLYIVNLR